MKSVGKGDTGAAGAEVISEDLETPREAIKWFENQYQQKTHLNNLGEINQTEITVQKGSSPLIDYEHGCP